MIKQISLFDTANSHDKDQKFQFKIKKTFDQKGGQNGDMVNLAPPRYYLGVFYPNTFRVNDSNLFVVLQILHRQVVNICKHIGSRRG